VTIHYNSATKLDEAKHESLRLSFSEQTTEKKLIRRLVGKPFDSRLIFRGASMGHSRESLLGVIIACMLFSSDAKAIKLKTVLGIGCNFPWNFLLSRVLAKIFGFSETVQTNC